MNMLFDAEGLVRGLEHHADVNVKGRSVRGKGGIVCVLDIASGPLAIRIVNPVGDVPRIQILDTVEASLGINLGLGSSVLVSHEQAGDSGKTCHLGIIGAEGRGDVDYAGTVFGGNIITEYHAEGASVGTEPRDKLLVAKAFQLAALEGPGKHLIRNFIVEPCSH